MDRMTREALRYMGYKSAQAEADILSMVADTFDSLSKVADQRIIYKIFDIQLIEEQKDSIPAIVCHSRNDVGIPDIAGSGSLLSLKDSAPSVENDDDNSIENNGDNSVENDGDKCGILLADMKIFSQGLLKNLRGCHQAILLGATLGAGVDRFMRTASIKSMASAVVLQACAAAYLEEFLDKWQEEKLAEFEKDGLFLRPRFSPGYGDFSIDHQGDILNLLEAPKKIGLSMTTASLLTPTKSVTAIIGISRDAVKCPVSGCEACEKFDCTFRR